MLARRPAVPTSTGNVTTSARATRAARARARQPACGRARRAAQNPASCAKQAVLKGVFSGFRRAFNTCELVERENTYGIGMKGAGKGVRVRRGVDMDEVCHGLF